MRSILLSALIVASLPKQLLTPEASLGVRWIQAAEISPDGTNVIIALKASRLEDNTSATHVYVVPATGGAMRQLTFAGSSNVDPAWSPDGKRIAFASTRDDVSQIYVLELTAGAEAKRLTSLAGGASGPIWSRDGRTIAFVSRVHPDCRDDACNKARSEERARSKIKARAYEELLYRHWSTWDEGTRSHIFVIRSDGSGGPRDLTPGPFHAPAEALGEGRGYAFAGDDALVYCANTEPNPATSTNNDLFIVPLSGGTAKRITPNKALDREPIPSPDGRYVAYVAFARPGFEADRGVLWIWDQKTDKRFARTESFDRSIDEIAWTPDGSGLYVTAFNHGAHEVHSVGREAGEVSAPLIAQRAVQLLSVSKKGTMAFVDSSFTSPPEVFLHDPETRATRQISHINDAFIEGFALGRAEEIEADVKGAKVHGYVAYPPDFRPDARYPLVVLLHGGPQGAFNDTWHSRWNAQLFAAKGYVVAMPNFRGSIGYGQAFVDAVSRDWGGRAYDDVIAFVDEVAKRPFVDPKRMCAAGASYGGYLVNWIAGHTDRFRCLITHAGIFNLESMWGDTEELWFPEWEFGGPPWSGRDSYRRWSPHEYIQHAKTPMLVTHGSLDFRVNLSQGQQLFTSLRRLDVPARFVYFPDEGHWITKPQNYVYWYNEMLGWLGRYLR